MNEKQKLQSYDGYNYNHFIFFFIFLKTTFVTTALFSLSLTVYQILIYKTKLDTL